MAEGDRSWTNEQEALARRVTRAVGISLFGFCIGMWAFVVHLEQSRTSLSKDLPLQGTDGIGLVQKCPISGNNTDHQRPCRDGKVGDGVNRLIP
jgi:hypothetical protein